MVACKFSSLSGLVTDVYIGTPAQEIKMAFDFTSVESTLYAESDCPAFVNCFSTYIWDYGDRLKSYFWLDYSNFVADFKFEFGSPDRTYKFRDVSGKLGAGPDSELLAGRVMAISANSDGGIDFDEFLENWRTIVIESVSKSRWEFPGIIGKKTDSRFVLDFSVGENIVIPLAVCAELGISCDGLEGRWTDSPDTDLELDFGQGIMFKIRPKKIYFSPGDITYVGGALLNAVSKIILDYDKCTISFVSQNNQGIPKLNPKPLVHAFSQPFAFQFGKKITSSLGSEFVLESASPDSEIDAEERVLECWHLLRVQHSGRISKQVLRGAFEHETFNFERNIGITWKLESSKFASGLFFSEFYIDENPGFVDICGIVEHDLSEFRLPAPETNWNQNHDDCAVCLDSIKSGDMIQKMEDCNHSYHADCVRHWIRRNPSCPMCRGTVRKRGYIFDASMVDDTYRFPTCTIC